jgi:hypothetical protein
MAADPNVVAAYRRGLVKAGVPVTVTRINGFAPNAVTFSAENITAIVRDYRSDASAVSETGFASAKMGAITQGDRLVIVMADDLAQAGFQLPLKKNDRITLSTGDVLNVTAVDALKRAAAGAIELKAAGVS